MRKLTSALLLAGLITVPAIGRAENMPEKPAVPEPGALMGGFDFGGHVDVGYTHLSGFGRFTSGINNRVFDFDKNAVNLQAVDLQVSKLPENGFGALLDVTVGRDADTIAAYGTIDKNRGPAAGVNKKFDVTQAYLHYATGPLMVIAGKYVTLAGAEVIKSPSDTNYSRSILFGYAIPFTHTGVRATYKVNDMATVIAGVNNGWDDFQDTNGDNTLELGLSLAPTKSFSLAAQAYSGKEQIFNYPTVSPLKGTRNLLDVVATYNATDKLSLVLNYDNGSQGGAVAGGTAKWDGWAAYANYQFNDLWRLSLRGEVFNDKDGYRTGIIQKWKEVTATLAYMPTKSVELRGEVRADRSDKNAFLDTDAVTPKGNQQSFGLEAIYKF